MKVLQVVKTSDGANWAFEQAKWLQENGIEMITILPCLNGKIAQKYIDNNMKIIQGDFSLPITKPWQFFSKKSKLIKIIDEEKPDILHFHFVTNILFARLALRNKKIPRLFQLPGPLHLENKLIRNIEIALSNEYDYWAPACQYSKKIYNKYVDNSKVFLAYYGGYGGDAVNNYEDGNLLHKQYGIDTSKITIGMISYFYKPKYYIGQIRGIKGHEDFIDAINILNKKYKNIQAIIIGGPWGNSHKYESKVKEYVKRRNIDNIIFTGFRNDIKQIYREINIAVHPSHSENLGGAAESLAAGVPTVSTNVGGFPDIVINNETGYTCQAKNPQALADAISKVIDNYKEAQEMAKNGQKKIEDMLDIKNCANEIKKIYIKLKDK